MSKKKSKSTNGSKSKTSGIPVHNLELGMPSLEEARQSLNWLLTDESKRGTRVVKIIHGYGSSGRGGILCPGLRRSLALRKNEGRIKGFIRGEDFGLSMEMVKILDDYPLLKYDNDYNRTNPGITIILIS